MTLAPSRRSTGEPSPDLARGLGRLLVSSAHLAAVSEDVAAVSDVQPELERLDAPREQWREVAVQLLELRAQIDQAAAEKTFTGSAGEHLVIRGREGIVIAADAGYITVLSRRMDRHARMGRLFAVTAHEDDLQL
jgi:hypothetical protein